MSWVESRLRTFAVTGAFALAFCASANAQTPAFFGLPVCEWPSTAVVLSIEPASGHASTLLRAGQEGRLHNLANLCPGDVISVGPDDEVRVATVGDPSAPPPFDESLELILRAGRYMVGFNPPVIVGGGAAPPPNR